MDSVVTLVDVVAFQLDEVKPKGIVTILIHVCFSYPFTFLPDYFFEKEYLLWLLAIVFMLIVYLCTVARRLWSYIC